MRSDSERASPVLPLTFFRRPTLEVCEDLLGASLCRRREQGPVARYRIHEVEAYDGFEDRASHAHRGQTPRNQVMFGPGGCWYVYLCYGVHWLLNMVCGDSGHPSAILIRGAGDWVGPGRLTRGLGVNRDQNGLPATRKSGLWIEAGEGPGHTKTMERTPRIGIDSAGPEWAGIPWRFVLKE